MRTNATPVRCPQALIYIFLFVIACIPRLLWLQTIPTGISNDELDYVINAKTLFLTGHGLTGNLSPIRITDAFPQAELISVFLAPYIGPVPFSLFSVRLPFAILGALTVILLYRLVKNLIGEKEAFAVGLVASINPWNIYFSRTTYDAPVTTFFLLLGLTCLLSKRRLLIVASCLPFLSAFHTYMGMMVVFPFFLLISLYFAYTAIRKNPHLKEYSIVGVVCMLFVFRYMIALPHMAGGIRMGELALPNSPAVSAMTDAERKLTITTPLGTIVNNKVTSYVKMQTEKYLTAFSPSVLFLHGDPKRIFTLYEHGFFYPFDIIFLLLGFGVLFASNKRILTFLLALVLIAPLPSLASNEGASYASRSYLLQPIFLIFIGCGIAYAINTVRHKRMFITLLSIIYGISLVNFASIYLLRNPIANSESSTFSARVMTDYAKREIAQGRDVFVISDDPKTPLKYFAFYTDGLNRSDASAFTKAFVGGHLELGKFKSVSCVEPEDIGDTTTIIIEGKPLCTTIPKIGRQFIIPLLTDGGSVYEIYQGKTCSGQKPERFPHDIAFPDFALGDLPEARFCEKFITEY
jgi:4-amino-4-deoxy-L-arabinose transferase-like glycosyltransferase